MDEETTAEKLARYEEALRWICMYEAVGVARAARVQRVASRVLYRGMKLADAIRSAEAIAEGEEG
jgi:hypothetical protein